MSISVSELLYLTICVGVVVVGFVGTAVVLVIHDREKGEE